MAPIREDVGIHRKFTIKNVPSGIKMQTYLKAFNATKRGGRGKGSKKLKPIKLQGKRKK